MEHKAKFAHLCKTSNNAIGFDLRRSCKIGILYNVLLQQTS